MKKINKKMLFAAWACTNTSYFSYQSWSSVLHNLFQNVVVFDPQEKTYSFGRKKMNEEFLNTLKKEKPDYIFFWFMYPPEFDIETLGKIKEISPKTKILNFFGDDDILFDVYTKYLSFFVDYPLASHMEYFWKYKSNNIKNAFSTFGVNTDNFKPLYIGKIYDVTFIGTPIEDRAEMIKHLVDNGINVKIFGGGWYNYQDLAPYYGGKISAEEMAKIINQSKINLNFSKTIGGKTGFKAKVFEVCACKSFLLSEYFTGYLDYLIEGKEIITFKNKHELLEKVRYYLNKENEREKIASSAHDKVINNYSIEKEFRDIFSKINNLKKPEPIHKINKKEKIISKEEFKLDNEELIKKLKDSDYVSFSSIDSISSDYKSYFQMLSLENSDKSVSSCDYSVFSKSLGDYLYYYGYKTFNANKPKFYSFLNIFQLMVKKDFFIKNIDKFKNFQEHKEELVNADTTTFIAFPLLRRIGVNGIGIEDLGSIFAPNFENELKALAKQKKILISPYLYNLILSSYAGKSYLRKHIMAKIRLKLASKS